ncbi:MAG: hypothetical protein OEU26_16670 [Candidatus Tectomicrobia bacterium]|nr:hypothetical protein [Candidatus Tectomicrobia bacterium]
MELRQGDIEYYVNRAGARKAVIFYVVLALLFIFVLFFVGADAELSLVSKALAFVAGVGGVVAFSYLGLVFRRRLNSKEPLLVLNVRGVFDNASGMSSGAGWIEWSEIADIRVSRYHNLPCVEVVLKNREMFLQRFGWMERVNRSSRLGYPAVAIRGPLLPVEPAMLAEQMRTYWQSACDT